jgi:leucyl aminopeptidase
MKINLKNLPKEFAKITFLVLPVISDNHQNHGLPIVKDYLTDNPDFGKLFDSQLLYSKNQQILLLGIGAESKIDYQTIQNWAGAVAKQLSSKSKNATVLLPVIAHIAPEIVVEATVLGLELFSHDPSFGYKSDYKLPKLKEVDLCLSAIANPEKSAFNKAEVLAESMNLVKQLGDSPANHMTPTVFLKYAKQVAAANRLKLTVLNEKQAKKKGMGAFVGVAQGSDEPSYMIAIEYWGDPKTKQKTALVGKGITFDTGGISIKPASNMHEMKYDMCGAATVLGTLDCLAKLKIKANVVAVMAVTENLLSGKAQRPGDVVMTYSGKTAEILNTDAEGRLVLVDALTWAQRDFQASKLIDLATLTGAMIVALGDHITGVFGNNPEFTQKLIQSGAEVGEKYWELPLGEEFDDMVKSDIADLTNIGHGGSMPGAAGSITAAKFIEAVIEKERPWIHLDIAGTAWDMKPRAYRPAGATGVGVKTLLKLISN